MRVAYLGGGERFVFDVPEVSGAAPHDLYRAYAADGALLYVGISGYAATRIQQHRKSARWYPDVARWDIQTFPCRADAQAAETAAIRGEQPRHNVKGPARAA